MYYRLRLIFPHMGVDESGPLQSSLQSAREVARQMITVYQGKIKVEIRRVVNLGEKQSEWIETIAPYGYT